MLFVALLLLCSMSVTVYAHEVPDPSREGSIMITMDYENKAVPGGALELYRVGAVVEDGGNYSFALTGDFIGSGASLEDVQSPQLAKYFAGYADEHNVTGETGNIGCDGTVLFSDLELGLYLIVQTEVADGYLKVNPFLVSLPMYENGIYLYDVDASPKIDVKKDPAATIPSSPEEISPSKPGLPSSATLPQTGQLNWPIPILTILGLMLFSAGWMLRFGRKRKKYEK